MSRAGSPPPLGDLDLRLLKALHAQYADDRFDAHNISVDAPLTPELLEALDFLNPRINRRCRALSHRSREAVERWIDNVEDRDIGAGLSLRLRRDKRGWCYVGPTGSRA